MKYSESLVKQYSQKREQFNETDKILFDAIDSVGVIDKSVLDLGCGDGRHSQLIKEMGASNVLGVDVNEKMIELARENNKYPDGVSFTVADGKKIPVSDACVDVVVSNFVIHYFENSAEVFCEISRVLKIDGFFVGIFNIAEVDEGYEYLYNKSMPIRLGQGEGSIVVQNLIKSREEIQNAILASGLEVVQEKELNHPNAVIDDTFREKDYLRKVVVLMVLRRVSR